MKFRVKLTTQKKPVDVEADYYRIVEGGVLVFRLGRDANHYPLAIHTFAAGAWRDVKVIDTNVVVQR